MGHPLAQKMTAFRLPEATRPLVSYCATCRAVLAAAGRDSLHLLDLVFNPGWQTAQTAPPRRLPETLVEPLAAEAVAAKTVTTAQAKKWVTPFAAFPAFC